MAELKCPHCKQVFTVDDTELSSIVQQIRDREFEKDLSSRISEMEEHLEKNHKLELASQENEIKLSVKEEHEKQLQLLRDQLKESENKAQVLQNRLNSVVSSDL